MEDIIGFNSYINSEGRREYGCRGIGVEYKAFYDWVYTTSYKCMVDDFPWDYFIFTDTNDENEFIKRYGNLIDYQE